MCPSSLAPTDVSCLFLFFDVLLIATLTHAVYHSPSEIFSLLKQRFELPELRSSASTDVKEYAHSIVFPMRNKVIQVRSSTSAVVDVVV